MSGLVMTSRLSSLASSPGSIDDLPLELIREIFLFSSALKFERLTDDSPIPPRFSTTALALSHVSTHWRFIALSFPELWASIAVCCPTEHIVELSKLYLERSGATAPLDLSLVDVLRGVGPCDDWHAASSRWEVCSLHILRSWIPQAHRWMGLNLNLRDLGAFRDLLEIPPQSLKNLERASLDLSHWRNDQVDRMWDIIHTSERLREVHWCSPLQTRPPLTSFRHITDLFVWSISFEELSNLPSLTKLAVRGFKESANVAMVAFPVLESLSMDSLRKDSSWLFDQVTTPNLRQLRFVQSAKLLDVSALHRFISRTNCPLQRLHLRFYHSSEADVLQYMRLAAPLLPHLRALSLGVDWVTELTVNALTPRVDNGQAEVFLPLLKALFLFDCRLEDGLIGKMLVARAAVGEQLVTFKARLEDKGRSHSMDEAILHQSKQSGVLKGLEYLVYEIGDRRTVCNF
ncbi:hypothetical protein BDN72DRAFT_963226 [Pluteus cervinus]|uniref:Uncharacterized protein n=1 Tax=Pluteus cervinus TaxID=181527 RepID=A0ACD3AFF1_9AGAR|nr:hypothetical protein BDN72DRAFT_963226 [Pluteus cervinus]